MTLPTLDQLLDAAEVHAKHVCIGLQQQLMPIFHLCDAKGQGFLIAGEFEGATPQEVINSKDAIADFVRLKIIEHKAVQYSFLSEAWMIVRQVWKPGISTPPADSADRVEVVIVIATDGKNYKSRRWLMKREGKKCVDLVLDTTLGETETRSGRFDNLLTPKEEVG